jgi:hypothetical protein
LAGGPMKHDLTDKAAHLSTRAEYTCDKAEVRRWSDSNLFGTLAAGISIGQYIIPARQVTEWDQSLMMSFYLLKVRSFTTEDYDMTY